MSYDLSGMSFLLVDDDRLITTLIRDVLHGFGVKRVHFASNGQDALALLAVEDVDVVIADLMMEPMDGLTFTRTLRRGEAGIDPFLPIIMLTGFSDMEKVAEARDSGITEFLAKPVTARALYQRIVTIIERPRPFVRAQDFVGPDRRRRADDDYDGEERRDQDDPFDI